MCLWGGRWDDTGTKISGSVGVTVAYSQWHHVFFFFTSTQLFGVLTCFARVFWKKLFTKKCIKFAMVISFRPKLLTGSWRQSLQSRVANALSRLSEMWSGRIASSKTKRPLRQNVNRCPGKWGCCKWCHPTDGVNYMYMYTTKWFTPQMLYYM